MQYVIIVHKLHGIAHLLYHPSNALFTEPPLCSQAIVEISRVAELH